MAVSGFSQGGDNAMDHSSVGMLSMCLEIPSSQVIQHSGDTARSPVVSSDKTSSSYLYSANLGYVRLGRPIPYY